MPAEAGNYSQGNTMTEATTATGPEPALSWLDKATADAMSALERIHADARTALDTISPETAPIVGAHAETALPE